MANWCARRKKTLKNEINLGQNGLHAKCEFYAHERLDVLEGRFFGISLWRRNWNFIPKRKNTCIPVFVRFWIQFFPWKICSTNTITYSQCHFSTRTCIHTFYPYKHTSKVYLYSSQYLKFGLKYGMVAVKHTFWLQENVYDGFPNSEITKITPRRPRITPE